MELLLLYLFAQIDTIKETLFFLAVCSLVSAIVMAIIWGIQHDSYINRNAPSPKLKLMFIWGVVFSLAIFLVNAVLPSQKGLAIIVGGHFAITAVQSETAGKIHTIINGVLDKEIEKLKETVQK